MITIFTVPKPFEGQTAIIQRNAIQSWKQLHPACEIILCGDEKSIKNNSIALDVKQISSIEHNEFGTPFLNSVFQCVANIAQYPVLCFVNTDIIFTNDMISAVKHIQMENFLAVGKRYNLNINEPLDFSCTTWDLDIQNKANMGGKYSSEYWIDYFIFPINSGLYKIPPFLVGRPTWDNWFICNARRHHIPIIDITTACTAIHQNHDYSHVPRGTGVKWMGPESDHNSAIYDSTYGQCHHLCSVYDATHVLYKGRVVSAISIRYLIARFHGIAVSFKFLIPMVNLIYIIRNTIKKYRKRNYI